ncbi:MAG: polysulfide reductase NrfD [Nitrospinae bacterium]|nr:polysulfide reductase NrfD [Nitrospinota bacterium]
MVIGLISYAIQMSNGFIVTAIRDQVSWGFYISNFTFLVGVAAAAVLLVLPAYVYHFKPIKEIVFLGEMMAITAICMCILFVTVDLGHPERVWHMLPLFGSPNFPRSMLTWDVLVLNGYLIINATVFFYIMYKLYEGADYNKIMPLVLLSIPWAVSIHTVTAFLYNGLGARPFWNASILAPRFLASAFCSGPALMILVLQIVRKMANVPIDNKAIFKLSELIAYTMALNIFLLFCEVFKEVYSDSIHLYSLKYLYFGLHGHNNLVPWMWTALVFNSVSLFLFLYPKTSKSIKYVNAACVMTFIGVYIEKGFGLIIPGFVPDTLGEIYEYSPSIVEIGVTIGIWATGALIYTMLFKFAYPIYKKGLPNNGERQEG